MRITDSENIKQEIMRVKFHSRREKMAFLSAFVRAAGMLVINGSALKTVLRTDSAEVATVIQDICGEVYKSGIDGAQGKKAIELSGDYLIKLLSDCCILQVNKQITIVSGIDLALVNSPSEAAAYIRGAFLGAGSVTFQEKYHLEFVFESEHVAQDFVALLLRFDIVSKITQRKDKHIVYIKDSNGVCDCLAVLGANRAVLALNNIIAKRQVATYANRFTNCEIYNLGKQVDASVRQVNAAKFLLEKNVLTDAKMIETARARIAQPDHSFSELSELLNISKSGVKHRLNKICGLYDEIIFGGDKEMVIKEVIVKNCTFTSREIENIVSRAMRYDSDIIFEQGSRKINAKSLMGVISMALKGGDKIMLIIKGDDQDEALADMVNLFNKGFKNV